MKQHYESIDSATSDLIDEMAGIQPASISQLLKTALFPYKTTRSNLALWMGVLVGTIAISGLYVALVYAVIHSTVPAWVIVVLVSYLGFDLGERITMSTLQVLRAALQQRIKEVKQELSNMIHALMNKAGEAAQQSRARELSAATGVPVDPNPIAMAKAYLDIGMNTNKDLESANPESNPLRNVLNQLNLDLDDRKLEDE